MPSTSFLNYEPLPSTLLDYLTDIGPGGQITIELIIPTDRPYTINIPIFLFPDQASEKDFIR